MRRLFFLGLACCLSCQLLIRPDKDRFLENNQANCFDGIDNDENEKADCEDPSCAVVCQDDTLEIATLTPNNCITVTHETITGDDRGGIAVGTNHILYSGDDRTAAFDINDLNAKEYSLIYDGLFSDIRTGKVFTLLSGNLPINGAAGDLTGFQEIDTSTGDLIGTITTLSQPIPVADDTGVFSGKSRLVIHTPDDNTFDINLLTGEVTALGIISGHPPHEICENWAYWGVAEFFNDQLFMTYVSDSSSIIRSSITGSPLIETVAHFPLLSDMCSFTVTPLTNRWYFHSEGFTALSTLDENVGYCDALFGEQPITGCGDGVLSPPEECDDANAVDKDGCTGCVLDRCGDGLLNNNIQGNSTEACDDNNNNSGDGCRGDCEGTEVCGDGWLDIAEQCDDGNTTNDDGCEGDCNFACGGATNQLLMSFFDSLSGRCYVLIGIPTFWQDAEQLCVGAGGHLATIDTQTANDLVLPAAASFAPWIGFNDLTTEGAFEWVSGSPIAFTGFANGEPNNSTGNEDCVSDTDIGWNDLDCAESHKPLCEVP